MSNKYKANKSRGRHVYQYFSQKNQAPLKVESFLELCVAAQMECEPNIVAYAAQLKACISMTVLPIRPFDIHLIFLLNMLMVLRHLLKSIIQAISRKTSSRD